MRRVEKKIWYTVYEASNDRLVVIGYANECATFMGWTVNTFRSVVSNVKSGKNKAYCVVVENLETGSYDVYGGENTGILRGRPKMIDDDSALDMYYAGKSDHEMACKLGVNFRSVWGWRKKRNLPPNAKRGRPRKVVA